jgi:hypothetical protein
MRFDLEGLYSYPDRVDVALRNLDMLVFRELNEAFLRCANLSSAAVKSLLGGFDLRTGVR